MRTYPECVACLVRQAVDLTLNNVPEHEQHAVLKVLVTGIANADFSLPPPMVAMEMYELLRTCTGIEDPYAAAKNASTHKALGYASELSELIARSADPLDTAMRIAVAGNIIDFGINSPDPGRIHETVSKALHASFAIDYSPELKERLALGGNVLYLADNAGEIVFDRLLIQQIGPERVTCAVRDMPVINDATLSDATRSGLSQICRVITSGSRAPGTPRQMWTDEFRQHFQEADVVISKGQGNFETLSHIDRDVFFLFMVKCGVISREVGAPLHSFIALKQPEKQDGAP
ncbi:MAG TPA: DUF89 family protein [Deltaproteobacteria bacterium]|nr:DUF89 family protein [Deltaproteobacteria bacterium]